MAKKKKEDVNETAHRVFQDFLKISDPQAADVKAKKQASVERPSKKDK